jgi:hypothetical protein
MPDNENAAPRPPKADKPDEEKTDPAVTNAFEKSAADLKEVVEAVAKGEWGEGQVLRDRLIDAGFDPRVIRQKIVDMYRQ